MLSSHISRPRGLSGLVRVDYPTRAINSEERMNVNRRDFAKSLTGVVGALAAGPKVTAASPTPAPGSLARAQAVIVATAAVIAIAGAFRASAATAQTNARPNIIVILVDDMGWSDIGSYGGEIPTPNLDALAARGVRFTQFYSTPRCSPTRASLLTGLYPHQAGMGHLDTVIRDGSSGTTGRLNERSVTIAEVLRDAGYFTAMSGKWHLGQQNGSPPWQRGFDRVLSLRAGGMSLPQPEFPGWRR